jgi:hypothetical protein
MIGVNMGVWTLFLILSAIVSIGLIRVVSANGGMFMLPWRMYWDTGWYSWIGLPLILAFGVTALNWETLATAWLTLNGDICRMLWGAVTAAILTMAFYKTGKLTKTKERSIFVAAIIGLSLAALLSLPLSAMFQEYMACTIAWPYWTGAKLNNDWFGMKNNMPNPFMWFMNYAGMGGAALYQSPEYSILTMALGFIVMLVFALLRQRFSWMVVTTTGIFLGTMWGSELWLPMILAIALKYITLRVGGTGRYDSVGKPLAIGLLGGTGVHFVISTIIWYANRLPVGASYPA